MSDAGWICDQAGNATTPVTQDAIVFKARLGQQLQLQLTYLVSWQSMGAARVALHSANTSLADVLQAQPLATYTLHGNTTERFSVPRTTVFVSNSTRNMWPQKSDVQLLPAVVRAGECLVVVSVGAANASRVGKFKLLGLASC